MEEYQLRFSYSTSCNFARYDPEKREFISYLRKDIESVETYKIEARVFITRIIFIHQIEDILSKVSADITSQYDDASYIITSSPKLEIQSTPSRCRRIKFGFEQEIAQLREKRAAEEVALLQELEIFRAQMKAKYSSLSFELPNPILNRKLPDQYIDNVELYEIGSIHVVCPITSRFYREMCGRD